MMGGGPGNFGTSASMGAANFARNGNFGPGGPIMPVGARFGVYCGCFARVSGLIIFIKDFAEIWHTGNNTNHNIMPIMPLGTCIRIIISFCLQPSALSYHLYPVQRPNRSDVDELWAHDHWRHANGRPHASYDDGYVFCVFCVLLASIQSSTFSAHIRRVLTLVCEICWHRYAHW
jgi:hypothetical protein